MGYGITTTSDLRFFTCAAAPSKKTSDPHLKEYLIHKGCDVDAKENRIIGENFEKVFL